MKSTKDFTDKQKTYFAILVYLFIPLGGISTDIYLPSLPAISHYFLTTKSYSQYTVTVFIFALGLSQLIAGPISDAIGRKKLILIAILVQLIAVITIIHATSIYTMIALRFIQGIGAAFLMVPLRATLNDLFKKKRLKKMFNYATISFALGPIIGPFIGGYLQHYIGWQANFYFIFIYQCIAIVLFLFTYKETIAVKHAFSITHLWKNYGHILSNKYYIICAFFCGFVFGYIALFNISGPFIIQTELYEPAITYGHIALGGGVAWFLGNILNRVLFNVDIKTKTQTAICLSFLTTIIFLVFSKIGYFNVLTLIIPTYILYLLNGGLLPIYYAESLSLFPSLAASANALSGAIGWVIFSIFTFISTFLKVDSLAPLAWAYLGVSIICIILAYGAISHKIKKSSPR